MLSVLKQTSILVYISFVCSMALPPSNIKLSMPTGGDRRSLSAASYDVVDLGTPSPGENWIQARAMSPSSRCVVGSFDSRHGSTAFLWKAGKFTVLSHDFAVATSVNDNGEVVGYIVLDGHTSKAVRWKDGKQQVIFADKARSSAEYIDNSGNVFGTKFDNQDKTNSRVYVLSPSGRLRYLSSPNVNGYFRCANQRGQVAMRLASRDSTQKQEVLWDGNTFRELPTPIAGKDCRVQGINSCGDAVGYVSREAFELLPVAWKSSKPELLGVPDGSRGSAVDINMRGVIVGRISNAQVKNAPFVIENAKLAYLKDLLKADTHLSDVIAVNDDGTILASGVTGSEKYSYLLKPITQ